MIIEVGRILYDVLNSEAIKGGKYPVIRDALSELEKAYVRLQQEATDLREWFLYQTAAVDKHTQYVSTDDSNEAAMDAYRHVYVSALLTARYNEKVSRVVFNFHELSADTAAGRSPNGFL